jgi:hypothetical protein
MDRIKLSELELQEIIDLRRELSQVVLNVGQLTLDKNIIEDQLETMQQKYIGLMRRNEQLIEKLEARYGAGNIDLSTGEFVPLENKE